MRDDPRHTKPCKHTTDAIKDLSEAKIKRETAKSLEKASDPLGAAIARQDAAYLEENALDFLEIKAPLTKGSGETVLERELAGDPGDHLDGGRFPVSAHAGGRAGLDGRF